MATGILAVRLKTVNGFSQLSIFLYICLDPK